MCELGAGGALVSIYSGMRSAPAPRSHQTTQPSVRTTGGLDRSIYIYLHYIKTYHRQRVLWIIGRRVDALRNINIKVHYCEGCVV